MNREDLRTVLKLMNEDLLKCGAKIAIFLSLVSLIQEFR